MATLPPAGEAQPSTGDLVRDFVRGQNLEQVGRVDEAVALYERAVAARFDAAGPYDRLIFIYRARAAHREVVRIAAASLEWVRTHPAKRRWYEQQIEAARAASGSRPRPSPR